MALFHYYMNKCLKQQVKIIKQLKQITDDYVKGKDVGIKIVLLKEFARELGTILEKYKYNDIIWR